MMGRGRNNQPVDMMDRGGKPGHHVPWKLLDCAKSQLIGLWLDLLEFQLKKIQQEDSVTKQTPTVLKGLWRV